jgi:hypothetical protein
MHVSMVSGILQSMTELVEDSDLKVTENRLRRVAERQGLKLQKSRRRDPRAFDYGAYWLIEPMRNVVVLGDGQGADLGAVAAYLGEQA